MMSVQKEQKGSVVTKFTALLFWSVFNLLKKM